MTFLEKVKYFGTELPPKCEFRGCYLTDDGSHYYCTDFTCNRHKYRRTKHNRYSRYAHLDPERQHQAVAPKAVVKQEGVGPLVYFRCPSCGSADIQMRILKNMYECSQCEFAWR